MASRAALISALAFLAGCLAVAFLETAFVGQSAGLSTQRAPTVQRLRARPAEFAEASPSTDGASSGVTSLLAGVCLGLMAFFAAPSSVSADVSDIVIPIDGKGKTTTLEKEQLVRGKRLFNQACAQCHVGGGTRTNQNVTLAAEELNNSIPARNTVEALIDYMNQPTTYDGLIDISETHPSIKAGDLWPIMASLKSSDLFDISSYILYQTQNIPEKWGGGKQYY